MPFDQTVVNDDLAAPGVLDFLDSLDVRLVAGMDIDPDFTGLGRVLHRSSPSIESQGRFYFGFLPRPGDSPLRFVTQAFDHPRKEPVAVAVEKLLEGDVFGSKFDIPVPPLKHTKGYRG